jgi:hypothetical protein
LRRRTKGPPSFIIDLSESAGHKMENEMNATLDLAGEWTLRYQPQQLAGEKREQHLRQQYQSTHPEPSPELVAKLQGGVKVRAPCDVHTGTQCATLLFDQSPPILLFLPIFVSI